MRAALALLAVAGIASTGHAQPVLHINADITNVNLSSTITWTVSVTGVGSGHFVSSYDFDLIATVDGVAVGALSPVTFSTFSTNLSPLLGPTAGTPGPGELAGVSGGQSSLIDPGNLMFGPVVIGTFETEFVGAWNGALSMTVADAGVLGGTEVLRVRSGSDFGPIIFNGLPTIMADSVEIPAPAPASLLVAAGLLATRRRRTH